MTIILSSSTTANQALGLGQDISILPGVSLVVSGFSAITGIGGNVQVTNFGTVFSDSTTISLDGTSAPDRGHIYNGLGGIISSLGQVFNDAAIFIAGFHAIENHGQINGNLSEGTGFRAGDNGTVTNFGVISGRIGVDYVGNSFAQCTLVNHGTITGTFAAIAVTGASNVTITNYGILAGAVSLGHGDTHLDSSEGVVRGTIFGGNGANLISAGRGGNEIGGGGGNDTLNGNAGNDTMRGGLGDDVLSGDEGDDTIYVEAGGESDTLDGGTGIDTLLFQSNLLNITFSIADPSIEQELADGTTFVNFERVSFYGNSGNDHVTGGSYADFFLGFMGDDTFAGGAGRDTLWGDVGADDLDGGKGRDSLSGGLGSDTLNGGAGADTLQGDAGSDEYIVDHAFDIVIETVVSNDLSERDIVTFIGSGTYTLTDNVEGLILGGTGATNGTGNSQGNFILGNSANNQLNGADGTDTLSGLDGSDTYFLDRISDLVVEDTAGAAGGIDTINISAASGLFTMSANVENLFMDGAPSALRVIGNEEANMIVANDGANQLSGMLGNDTLTGGGGLDNFIFNTALNAATNVDTITDFSAVDDTIRLENSVFVALGTGTGGLAAIRFKNTGLAAVDADDRILYNPVTGQISYDADGSGATAAIVFAVLQGPPTITNLDFVVI